MGSDISDLVIVTSRACVELPPGIDDSGCCLALRWPTSTQLT